jgi:hypothetical protein
MQITILLAQSACTLTCFSVSDYKFVTNVAGIKGVVRTCLKKKSLLSHRLNM